MKTVDDVMICPKCDSDNCYSYDTDEVEFEGNGTGHYYIDCKCKDCGQNFRLYTKFTYDVTEAYTRG